MSEKPPFWFITTILIAIGLLFVVLAYLAGLSNGEYRQGEEIRVHLDAIQKILDKEKLQQLTSP